MPLKLHKKHCNSFRESVSTNRQPTQVAITDFDRRLYRAELDSMFVSHTPLTATSEFPSITGRSISLIWVLGYDSERGREEGDDDSLLDRV